MQRTFEEIKEMKDDLKDALRKLCGLKHTIPNLLKLEEGKEKVEKEVGEESKEDK